MNYTIREAREEDMPQVLQLIKELAAFEKEANAVTVTSADLIRDGFGAQKLFQCFVGETTTNVIVGMALVYP
ncbi:MAG: GNAT family N-acetyltransferase, partial [Muriicola sp.]|nr:GNAT family N-acetyltransferase [Muriicola sp.]